MTKRIGNVVIFEETAPAKCELCEQVKELRPYGPNGENICYECGMKNLDSTERKFNEVLTGKKSS